MTGARRRYWGPKASLSYTSPPATPPSRGSRIRVDLDLGGALALHAFVPKGVSSHPARALTGGRAGQEGYAGVSGGGTERMERDGPVILASR
jgi:hypothetical protein